MCDLDLLADIAQTWVPMDTLIRQGHRRYGQPPDEYEVPWRRNDGQNLRATPVRMMYNTDFIETFDNYDAAQDAIIQRKLDSDAMRANWDAPAQQYTDRSRASNAVARFLAKPHPKYYRNKDPYEEHDDDRQYVFWSSAVAGVRSVAEPATGTRVVAFAATNSSETDVETLLVKIDSLSHHDVHEEKWERKERWPVAGDLRWAPHKHNSYDAYL